MTASQAPTQPVSVSRRYPGAPLVGTAVAVVDDQGRVLLVLRGRPPRAGTWGIPGGLLDLGERLVDGARREVREECGIEIEVHDLIAAFEPIVYDAEGRIEYHYVVLDYWGTLVSGEAAAADDAAAVAWASVEDMAPFALNESTTYVVVEAHRRWLARRTPP